MRFLILSACLSLLIVAASVYADVAATDKMITHKISCDTTKGPIKLNIYRHWAPLGADHFVKLVRDGFFTDIAFFRCVDGFLTQFGISDRHDMKHWHNKNIPDDPTLQRGIKRGYLSYAGGGPNTRSTQMFIAFEDLDFLGKEPWEVPFGQVYEGFDTLDKLFKGYGDIPPFGNGPDQQKIHNKGNAYVRELFPQTDFIKTCSVDYENRQFLSNVPDYMKEVYVTGKGGNHGHDHAGNLAAAASEGDLERVITLLEEGVQHHINTELLNRADTNGWSAIHEAVRGGHLETVKYLVEHGADIGAKTNNNGTPLWWARRSLDENHEVVRYLREIGAPEGDAEL